MVMLVAAAGVAVVENSRLSGTDGRMMSQLMRLTVAFAANAPTGTPPAPASWLRSPMLAADSRTSAPGAPMMVTLMMTMMIRKTMAKMVIPLLRLQKQLTMLPRQPMPIR